MRTSSPARCTEPSSRCATPSSCPIFALESLLPRNWNAELRLITFRPANCDSALIRSSESPSEKYCWSFWPLSLANGSTATDFSGMLAADTGSGIAAMAGGAAAWAATFASAAVAGWRAYRHNRPPPIASSKAMIKSSVPPMRCAPRSPWYHASTSTRQKPTASARMISFSTRSGQPKRCATTSSTWISANAAATYAAAHCTSLRCFSRSQKASTPVPARWTAQ